VLAPAIDATPRTPANKVSDSPPAAAAPIQAPAAVKTQEKVSDKAPAKAAEPQPTQPSKAAVTNLSSSTFRNDWPEIMEQVAKKSRSAWAVAFTTKVLDFSDDVLTLLFQSQKDVDAFKNQQGAAEVLRTAISERFGVKVKYKAKVAEAPEQKPLAPIIEPTAPEEFTEPEDYEEPHTEILNSVPEPEKQSERSGEFILREVLGATPIKGEDK
jgi:DNA polymerase-3 subunit gamma/tau